MPTAEHSTQDEFWIRNLEELLRELFAEGLAEAEARGALRGARHYLLRQLRAKFGELPPSVVDEVERADLAACEDLAVRLLRAEFPPASSPADNQP